MENRKQEEFIERIHTRISSAQHDINNPLSIIMGNAQLLAELAQAMELGEDIRQPAQDIMDAGQRISESLKQLDEIKEDIEDKKSNSFEG